MIMTLKLIELPTGMAFAQELAVKVTEVVENAVRVQPAGAAVLALNREPEFKRNRIA